MTTAPEPTEEEEAEPKKAGEDLNVEAVFARLKQIGGGKAEEAGEE